MDRQPLEQVEDQNIKQEAPDQIGVGVVDQTIDEIRTMRELSLMLGFDGDNFDGQLDKVLSVLKYAQSRSEDPLSYIKEMVKDTGERSLGKTLINKLYIYASLQNNIEELQQRQENLKDEH